MYINSSSHTIAKKRLRLLCIIAILFFTFLVYLNSLNNAFHFDDFHSITENPHIRDQGKIPAFFTHPEMFSGNIGVKMYRPLLLVTYVINYMIGGYEVSGYHAVNILLHGMNAVFVFLIASLLFNNYSRDTIHDSGFRIRYSPAFLAALLFGVHAINTQAVNHISSRSVLLVTFFYLGAFYFYIKSGEKGKESGNSISYLRFTTYYLLSFIFYICGLLSKEIAATFPLTLLVYDYLFATSDSRLTIHRYIKELPFWIVNLAGYLVLRKVVMGRALIELSWRTIVEGVGIKRSIYINVLTQAKVILVYIRSLFLPVGLAVEHDMAEASGIGDPAVLISLLVISLILLFAVYIYRKSWVLSFGIFWFFIALLPETILPLNVIVNEHRVYLPNVGFAFVIGIVFQGLSSRLKGKRSKVFLIGFMVLFISLNAYGTINRNRIWKDSYSLWKDAVEKYPDNAMSRNNLGVAYQKLDMNDKASLEFKESLKVDPYYPDAHNNLGFIYAEQGRFDKAIQNYLTALKLKPNYAGAHNNLGRAYAEQGRLDEAVKEYKKALKLKSYYPDAHNNLGGAYAEQGRLNEAVREYLTALKLKPDLEEVHYNLGSAYVKQGRLDEAIKEYRTALRLKADYAEAHNNLGLVYAGQGRMDEAVKEYKKALELEPEYVDAHNNLAIAYLDKGMLSEAKTVVEKTLSIDPLFADAVNTLGEIYIRLGNFKDAMREFERAINIEETASGHWNAALVSEKLELRDKAIAHWEKYITLNPDGEDVEEVKEHLSGLGEKIEVSQ